ncbi:transposase [Bradyrhizobium barranii]
MKPDARVCDVARRYGVKAQQLTTWRRLARAGRLALAPRVTSNSSGCGQSNSSTREAGQGTVSLSLFPGQELQRLL